MSDTVGDLKQACLDMANEAMAFFDELEAHGTEAPWVADNVLILGRLTEAHEVLRSYFLRMATLRMLQLGIPLGDLLKMVQ